MWKEFSPVKHIVLKLKGQGLIPAPLPTIHVFTFKILRIKYTCFMQLQAYLDLRTWQKK
jgi:hypothetical protein